MHAHPNNVPGEFVVEQGCCTLCGVPWTVAPELFGYDETGCWVARQPVTNEERAKMLKVIDDQEFWCVQAQK